MLGNARPAIVLLASLCGASIATPEAAAQAAHGFDLDATYRVSLGQGAVRGPADAPITIVEFSDFGCQFCGKAQTSLARLTRLYPGQIRMVFRHYPLDLEDGTLAAEASLAADAQGQFWPMHDRLFAAAGLVDRALVEDYAVELGLDVARFRADLDSRRFLPRIAQDVEDAARLGVSSTPMFFINGRAIKGALPLSVFADVVEQELARARSLIAGGIAPADVYQTIMARAATAEQIRRRAGASLGRAYQPAKLDVSRLYRVGLGLPGHTRGPDDAIVTVIAFTDFECPYCSEIVPALQSMLAEYPDEVRVSIRHLPLWFHPDAQLASEAVIAAAAQGKMWDMHDRLFDDQKHLSRPHLERHAREIGLDMKQFRRALDDRRYFDAVADDVAAAKALGIGGTPTVFINGTPLRGSAPYSYIKRVFLRPKLNEARQLVKGGIAPSEVYATLVGSTGPSELGDKTRFPDRVGKLLEDDYRTAVISACRARDADRARQIYGELKTDKGRDEARVDCQIYGVELRDAAPRSP